jgi:hypothetical protein
MEKKSQLNDKKRVSQEDSLSVCQGTAAGGRGGSRHLSFESIHNIRDLGGLSTSDGRVIRAGMLLRSSAVDRVSERDARTLAHDMDMRIVIDLRSAGEVDRTGRGLLSQFIPAYVNLPILSTPRIRANVLPDTTLPSLTLHYLAYLEHSHRQISMAVRILSDHAHLPALFHCAVGKDRTGVLAAVLLDALGVRHEEISADYALSREHMPLVIASLQADSRSRAAIARVPSFVLDADPATMEELLIYLRTHFGGGSGWLRAHGVARGDIDNLKKALLV